MASGIENITHSVGKMSAARTNLTDFEPIDVRYGYYGMFGTILFFQILNKIVSYLGPPKTIPDQDFWKWRNLFISWVHAFIVGTWTLYCLFFIPEYRFDLITYVEPIAYALVTFTTGYFLYDAGDMLVNNKLLKQWEVTLHHIAVTSMFFYNMATSRCIGYNIFALLAEVNSFFLHSRKLLQMSRFGFSHWLYRTTAFLNLFTFAVFRGLSLGAITMGMVQPGERLRVSAAYWWSLCASMFVMWGINPILFCRLLKNDFLRKDYEVQKSKVHLNNANNNVKKID